MRLVRFLLPKSWGTWLLTVVFLALLFGHTGTSIITFWGVTLLLVLGASLWLLSRKISPAMMDRVELTAPAFRIVPLALLSYFVIATLVVLPEAHSVRSWWEPILLRGGAPFSAVNSLALFGAFVVALTQTYVRQVWVNSKVVRGPKLISHEEAKAIAEKKLPPGSSGFLWGGVRLPMSRGNEHFCVIGDSGSGKSKSIHILLKSVLHSIEPGSNRRAVIFDAKRDLFSLLSTFGLSCPVITLHPMDQRGHAWDMAADISDPMVAIEIATILIPDKAEREPYFPNAARALLSGVMESLLRAAPGQWTLRDVVLALRYPKRVQHLLRTSVDTRYLVKKYVRDAKSSYDIASTIENTMRRLSFIAAAWELAGEKKVSLEKWLGQGESVLLLGRSPKLESTVAELNQALIHRLSQLIREQSDAKSANDGKRQRQTWVVIDELRMAGRLDGIKDLLVEGRSKGACVVIGFQDMPGLISAYDEHLAYELAGLPANKAFLRITETRTKDYASSCFGPQDIELARLSTTHDRGGNSSGRDHVSLGASSVSLSYQRLTQSVVLPSQFESDLPRPDIHVGLSGYYQTAAVGHPYFAKLDGQLVEAMLPEIDQGKIAEENRDFVPRFPHGADALKSMSLKEWTEADLKRLNLEKHPELLETDEDRAETPEQQDWSGILPERDP
jgi:Type IV secretion-system coupling protein DNA-binding domain